MIDRKTLPAFLEMPLIQYRTFRITCKEPNGNSGSRIVVYDQHNKDYVVLPRDYGTIQDQVIKYLKTKKIYIEAFSNNLLLTKDLTTELK